jgi:predicted metal-dependent TIM-barrel fold hydrolase
MKFFDPHIHLTSRTTDDYEAMARAGIAAVVEPAFWVGQPRTHVGTFEDYFLSLLGWERFRSQQFGIRHFCTIGLNPKEANEPRVSGGVIELMHRYLEKDGVVAVGEIGYDEQNEVEHMIFKRQIELAREYELPILIHTPHRDKRRGTERTIELVRELKFPPELTLIDHNNEETLPLVLESGCWAGHSIYPNTKMDETRMVALVERYGSDKILVNSAADWGVSDPLKVPKTAAGMKAAQFSDEIITKVLWENPVRFFAQSGRLDLGGAANHLVVDQRNLWEGNSVLRGQTPRVDKPNP